MNSWVGIGRYSLRGVNSTLVIGMNEEKCPRVSDGRNLSRSELMVQSFWKPLQRLKSNKKQAALRNFIFSKNSFWVYFSFKIDFGNCVIIQHHPQMDMECANTRPWPINSDTNLYVSSTLLSTHTHSVPSFYPFSIHLQKFHIGALTF